MLYSTTLSSNFSYTPYCIAAQSTVQGPRGIGLESDGVALPKDHAKDVISDHNLLVDSVRER